jgi:hypothetical protein
VEIEFIEPPAEAVEAPPQAPPVGRTRRGPALDLVAALLFAAAAVLAAVAPFQELYGFAMSTGGFRETVSSDGWGRFAVASTVQIIGTGHGARYGIVLSVLAGLSAVLAVVCLAVARYARPVRPVLRATAGAVVTAALGVGVALPWLDAAATLDSARRLSRPDIGRTLDDRYQLHTTYGLCLWLLLAATGCALVGTAALARRTTVRPVEIVPAPYATAAPDPEPGEELSW